MRSAAVLALLVTFGPSFFVISIPACRSRPVLIEPIVHDVRAVIAQLALAQVKAPLYPVQVRTRINRVLDLLGKGGCRFLHVRARLAALTQHLTQNLVGQISTR